jgi:hypothetical protein
MGAGCVAVHWSLSGAALAAVRSAAARRGLPVVGDLPIAVPLAEAAPDDVRLTSAVPPAPPARQPADWMRGWAALDPAAIDALAGSASAGRWAYTPSLLRWAQLAPDDALREQRWLGELLPRPYPEVLWPEGLAALAGAEPRLTAEEHAKAMANLRIAVHRLHAGGAPIHVGSATPSPYVPPGYGLWQEMLQLAGAGIALEEVWAAATRGAGEALGIPQLGTLEPGAPADLLIFAEDPTRSSNALTSLEAVVVQGRLYPKRLLNGYVMEYARYVHNPVYDRLLRWTAEPEHGCESP